jgi:uncharacterized protein YcfJ
MSISLGPNAVLVGVRRLNPNGWRIWFELSRKAEVVPVKGITQASKRKNTICQELLVTVRLIKKKGKSRADFRLGFMCGGNGNHMLIGTGSETG